MNQEELLKRIEELEEQNKKLKDRLNKNKKRSTIKTTKKEIVDYWVLLQDECGLSVDWAEAEERCWRCGYVANLQRCHIDAPNVESKTFMWDWIRANGTPFYDTFWNLRAQKEYEFVYGKSFLEELKDRDILSSYDLRLFWNLEIGKSIHHFAHPWNNESTEAGLLRMRLEEFDLKHPVIKKKSETYRKKERDFSDLIHEVCNIAKKYKFNVWEGRSKNRFSVTLSSFISRDKKLDLSIKLCKDNIYRACFTKEWNPNNNLVSDYTIVLGTKDDTIKFLEYELDKFTKEFGMQEKQKYVFTINPMYHLKYDED